MNKFMQEICIQVFTTTTIIVGVTLCELYYGKPTEESKGNVKGEQQKQMWEEDEEEAQRWLMPNNNIRGKTTEMTNGNEDTGEDYMEDYGEYYDSD